MAARIDLTGQRVGMLTIVRRSDERAGKRHPWICECDCGKTKEYHTNLLTKGLVQSCGCQMRGPKGPRIDRVGQRYGRLVVFKLADRNKRGDIRWLCQCDCGNTKITTGIGLSTGHTRSCGCAKGTHRHATVAGRSPTYASWQSMKARCFSPSNPAFAYYTSLGITVCERWMTFENFLADMGERPSLEYSIDRHPNKTGNYEPGNCRWATKKEQANNRVTNRPLEYRGKTYTMAELCAETGLTKDFLHSRLRHGWDVTAAVETPKIQPRHYPRWRKAAGIS